MVLPQGQEDARMIDSWFDFAVIAAGVGVVNLMIWSILKGRIR